METVLCLCCFFKVARGTAKCMQFAQRNFQLVFFFFVSWRVEEFSHAIYDRVLSF